MRLHCGTSGFSYAEWKGPFYPAELKNADMLRFYAERLSTVEINNTFYRMPRASVLEGWAATVPAGFSFALKASRRITHQARLAADQAGDSVAYLWKVCASLGDRLGPILFQLPPNMRADLDRLRAFLALLPEGCRAAFEFRHPSWADEVVFEALRAAGAAWCVADTDEEEGEDAGAPTPIVATADWGYLRLRREDYGEDQLAAWATRLRQQSWSEAFVYFKHEDGGAAPRLALGLTQVFRRLS